MASETTSTQRRCIGSARYRIAPHEAPIEDFPKQPSQKDGLGRMCNVHWNQYTRGLARDAKARKAAAEGEVVSTPETEQTPEPAAPTRKRSRRQSVAAPAPGAQGDAG